MIEVVAGLIRVNDLYLIAKRTDGDSGALNRFEFPGGKIEYGETPEDALVREAREELDINIKVLKYLCDYVQVYENRTIHLRLYLCESMNDDIRINSCHSEYKLVEFSDIGNYDLAVADAKLYNMIKESDNL